MHKTEVRHVQIAVVPLVVEVDLAGHMIVVDYYRTDLKVAGLSIVVSLDRYRKWG